MRDEGRPDGPLSQPVFTPADVEALSDRDRRRLARWLAATSMPASLAPGARHRRLVVLLVASGAAAALLPWLVHLAYALPETHRSREWRVAWVGFDAALAACLGATAWFGWRSRQVVISMFLASGVLVLCDAWFDVLLSWGSREARSAIMSALFLELPFAVFLLWIHHRLAGATARQIWRDRGFEGEPPPLHRLPLLVRARPARELELGPSGDQSGREDVRRLTSAS